MLIAPLIDFYPRSENIARLRFARLSRFPERLREGGPVCARLGLFPAEGRGGLRFRRGSDATATRYVGADADAGSNAHL